MRTNSYVEYILGIYSAMLFDIVSEIPSLRRDAERDIKRLRICVEQSGIRFLMVSLPAVAKHLDQCLATGRLTPSTVEFHSPYKRRGVIPRLFKGLYLRVFHESGDLRIDCDVRSILFLRTLLLLCKKYRMDCQDSDTFKAVEEFYEVDKGCLSPSLSWDDDCLDDQGGHDISFSDRLADQFDSLPLFRECERDPSPFSSIFSIASYNLQVIADMVSTELGWFDPSEWRLKHGPGAVSDLKPGISKYTWSSWPERLERVFPFADFGFANFGDWAAYSSAHPSSIPQLPGDSCEGVAKLIAVPKVLDKPRLIASEPTSHQWCQQSILRFMADSVSKTSISSSVNFHSQEMNRVMALKASLLSSHWTIDLSSASDRMSCWMVERFFRRNRTLLEALHATRTRFIRNDIDKKSPRLYKLRKFSTMGSACTFPVQTYVFATVAIAAVLSVRGLKPLKRNIRSVSKEVRIFGDDIIIPKDAGILGVEMLQAFGFKINPSKTFSEGQFRESCGIEAFAGENVSRTSVLTSPSVSRPESIMSSVDVHNSFLIKGFVNAASFIKSTVSKMRGLTVPSTTIGSGLFGFWSFDPWADNASLKKRFSSVLHRTEVRVTSLIAKGKREPTEANDMVLQYFTEVCKPPERDDIRLGVPYRPATKLSGRWVSELDLYS